MHVKPHAQKPIHTKSRAAAGPAKYFTRGILALLHSGHLFTKGVFHPMSHLLPEFALSSR